MTDEQAMIEAMRLNPINRSVLNIVADWMEDHDRPEFAAELRHDPAPNGESDSYGDGGGYSGVGYGGFGGGYGDGGGYGGVGYGGGYGGYGGFGGGYGGYGGFGGYGSGFGSGFGDSGRFTPGTKGNVIMRAIGERVLVLVPGSYSNFAFCGVVGECVGAHVWRLEKASMVINSGNGPDWMALARGENRGEARFSACPEGAVDVGPQFGGVFPWVGELP